MGAELGYRKRSRDVRTQARAHIAALRAARRAAGNAATETAAGIVSATDATGAPAEAKDRSIWPDADIVAAVEEAAGRAAATTAEVSVVEVAVPAPKAHTDIVPEAEAGPRAVAPDPAGSGPPEQSADPASTTLAGTGSVALPDSGPEASPETGPAPVPPAEASAETADGGTKSATAAGPGTSAAVNEDEATTGPSGGDSADPGAGAAPEAPPEAGPAVSKRPEGDATSDLFRLPGAGSGLVWMLEQAGVRSLADLAAADVGELETALGLVGQLLDVENWVTFARDRAARQEGDRGEA